MKPLFADQAKPTAQSVAVSVEPVPPGFKDVTPMSLVTQSSKPMVVARVITDAEIDKLGERNSSRVAETTKKIIANIKASDTEGMGLKLNELVVQAKKLDPKTLGKPGFFGRIFGAAGNVKEKLMGEFATVETQVNRLTGELDGMAKLMDQRVGDCDKMFEENFQTYQALQQDIAAGELMIQQLDDQVAQLGTPTDAFGAQTVADLQSRADRLRKRVDDFQRGSQLAINAAPEIRMQQSHCRSLVSAVRDIKVTTLPAFMGVFSRYVLSLETKKGVELVNTIYDATDAAFRTQADQLRQNAQQVARAQQRSVVTIETLEHMQTQLFGAIDDAKKIAEEGRAAREAAKPKLKELEQGLIARFSPPALLSTN